MTADAPRTHYDLPLESSSLAPSHLFPLHEFSLFRSHFELYDFLARPKERVFISPFSGNVHNDK